MHVDQRMYNVAAAVARGPQPLPLLPLLLRQRLRQAAQAVWPMAVLQSTVRKGSVAEQGKILVGGASSLPNASFTETG